MHLCGSYSGSRCSPYVESSEPKQSSTELESESYELDEEIEDLNNGNEQEFTSFIDAAGTKNFVHVMNNKNQ